MNWLTIEEEIKMLESIIVGAGIIGSLIVVKVLRNLGKNKEIEDRVFEREMERQESEKSEKRNIEPVNKSHLSIIKTNSDQKINCN